jgi:hypothetical protein
LLLSRPLTDASFLSMGFSFQLVFAELPLSGET